MNITIAENIEVLRRIIAFLGNYGSGKTEVAVNFAIALAKVTKPVSIADLDIVNPYFRCREARGELEKFGIETIFPKGEYFWADLPIILPEIKGVIERPGGHVILDIGGDDMGARILASFAESIEGRDAEFLFVLNLSRPFTDSVKGCVKMFKLIEAASNVHLTGLVVNTHLIGDTTPDLIYKSYEEAVIISKRADLPIFFTAIEESVLSKVDRSNVSKAILPLRRLMLKPWETPLHSKLGPRNFKL